LNAADTGDWQVVMHFLEITITHPGMRMDFSPLSEQPRFPDAMNRRSTQLHHNDAVRARTNGSPATNRTPTAKAAAVVGIGRAGGRAVRFGYGRGLPHGGLKAGNFLFAGEGQIDMADFGQFRGACGY
jgi:hypothetical protein